MLGRFVAIKSGGSAKMRLSGGFTKLKGCPGI